MTSPFPFMTGQFHHNGVPLKDAPEWGMTLRAAGSMRFRWNEENPVRNTFLTELAGADYEIVPIELAHSKTVYTVSCAADTFRHVGDGIITANRMLIPVVTAADCMPLFIYDRKTKVFGALHSGWRGTGIVEAALRQAKKDFGSNPEDFFVVMAPHIHDCCYAVDRERAGYFDSSFSPDCIKSADGKTFFLSLAKANVSILNKLGVPPENVWISGDCTCCNDKFGSFRRESVSGSGGFTVQAAWLKW